MSERFTEVEKQIKWFRDENTGLEWSETSQQTTDFYGGISWCVSVGGRLPSRTELLTLIDYNKYVPCESLSCTIPRKYWSSSNYAKGANCAWSVDFFDGSVTSQPKENYSYVRAVRGEMKR